MSCTVRIKDLRRGRKDKRKPVCVCVCACVRACVRVCVVCWGSLTRFAASITHLTFGKEYANAIEKKQVRPRPPAAVRSCARAGRGGGAGGA